MTIAVTVLYPAEAEQDWKMDYYLNKHMPLVGREFGKHGLKTWRITLPKMPDGSKGKYFLQADLIFDSADQVKTAFEKAGAAVIGDIPNFTSSEALIMPGEQIAFGEGEK